jgi:hypothetical protein
MRLHLVEERRTSAHEEVGHTRGNSLSGITVTPFSLARPSSSSKSSAMKEMSTRFLPSPMTVFIIS